MDLISLADGIIALLANNDESVRRAAVEAINHAHIDKEGYAQCVILLLEGGGVEA